MADKQQLNPGELANLELNRETVQDLTELEAEDVQGGLSTHPTAPQVRAALASGEDCPSHRPTR